MTATAFVVVALAVYRPWSYFSAGDGQEARSARAEAAAEEERRVAEWGSLFDVSSTGGMAALTARPVVGQIGSLSAADADRLGRGVAEVLDVFTRGDVEAMKAMLRRKGLNASEQWDAPEAAAAYATRSRAFRGAEFYAERGVWRAAVVEGRALPEVDPPGSLGGWTMMRENVHDRGPNDVTNPVRARTTALDYVVPTRFTADDGRLPVGQLVLRFTRRPADGEWLLAHVRMQNLPVDVEMGGIPAFD